MQADRAASSHPAGWRVSLRCELEEIRPAVQAVHTFLASQGWQDEELMSFDLALVEACANAVKYAGENGRKHPVELEADTDAAGVEFRVHDHTPGFEWPQKIELPVPTSGRGRGLYLISSIMDSADYFRGRNGNILVMRKRRAHPAVHENPAQKIA